MMLLHRHQCAPVGYRVCRWKAISQRACGALKAVCTVRAISSHGVGIDAPYF